MLTVGQTIALELAKVILSMGTAAGAAWLGFCYARKLESGRAIRTARAYVLELIDRIADIDEGTIPGVDYPDQKHVATIKLYMDTMRRLRGHVLSAVDRMGDKKSEDTQCAWNAYRTIKPHRHRARDAHDVEMKPTLHQVITQINTGTPEPREKCGRDVILRGLMDLRDALQP